MGLIRNHLCLQTVAAPVRTKMKMLYVSPNIIHNVTSDLFSLSNDINRNNCKNNIYIIYLYGREIKKYQLGSVMVQTHVDYDNSA